MGSRLPWGVAVLPVPPEGLGKALEALLEHRLVTTSSDWFPEGSYHVD